MQNFIYIPPSSEEDGDRQGYWLNLGQITVIIEESVGKLIIFAPGDSRPLLLSGDQAKMLRNYLAGQTYPLLAAKSLDERFSARGRIA